MQKRKKKHLLVDEMPAIPLDEAEIFKWRDRCPPDDDKEAWAALAKLKKRDMNDIAALGKDAFDDWWNDTSNMVRVSLPRSEDPEQVSAKSRSPIVNVLDLIRHYPELKNPIIHGLVRQGEIMNIVAPPKVGKTWLTLCIALCIIRGTKLFDMFQCVQGRVLIIDNELHCESIGHRVTMITDAIETSLLEWDGQDLDYMPLRGELVDLIALEDKLRFVRRGEYKAIILDAFYKFFPKDMRENDNAMMTTLYNQLDYYAEMLDTTFILVHHASKGNQSEKGVTDIGAGGGSQSRAADCHLVLREHEWEKTYVVDAAVRSWQSVESFCIRSAFPLWVCSHGADPTMLKGQKKAPGSARVGKGSGGQPDAENTPTVPAKSAGEAITAEMLTPMDAKAIADIAQRLGHRGFGYDTLRKSILNDWESSGMIRKVRDKAGNIPAQYIRADLADNTASSGESTQEDDYTGDGENGDSPYED